MAPPASPTVDTRRRLLGRIALYVVSFSLWLLLALGSRSRMVRIVGVMGCVFMALILVAYVRRYRELVRAGK
jgi:hypothetical protein